jgi:hypothetical protein
MALAAVHVPLFVKHEPSELSWPLRERNSPRLAFTWN